MGSFFLLVILSLNIEVSTKKEEGGMEWNGRSRRNKHARTTLVVNCYTEDI